MDQEYHRVSAVVCILMCDTGMAAVMRMLILYQVTGLLIIHIVPSKHTRTEQFIADQCQCPHMCTGILLITPST